MRRRIIAVLLSLSVGVAAMPMPVMAEGGSEVVLEEAAVEEAVAPEAEAAPAEEASVEEAPEAPADEAPEAPVEEAESVEAADELLIIDEEAAAVEEPAVETEAPVAEGDAVIEEAESGEEAGQELAVADDANPNNLHLRVNEKVVPTPVDLNEVDPNVASTSASGVTIDFDPFADGPWVPIVELKYDYVEDQIQPDGSTKPVMVTKTLAPGTDYVIVPDGSASSYVGSDPASWTAKFTIDFLTGTGYGNLNNWDITYTINRYDLLGAYNTGRVAVTYDKDGIYIYDGEDQLPDDLHVKVIRKSDGKEKELVSGVDFEVEQSGLFPGNLADAGVKAVQIKGLGKYKGIIVPDWTYEIQQALVAENIILDELGTYYRDVYTGRLERLKEAIANKIKGSVLDKNKKNEPLSVWSGDYTLGISIDGITLSNLTAPVPTGFTDKMLERGEHEVIVTISNHPNYKDGSVKGSYTIKDRSTLEDIYKVMEIDDRLANLEYNGKDQSSQVRNIIKSAYNQFNVANHYDWEITVAIDEKVMEKQGSYNVTISASADSTVGDAWPAPYVTTVTVGRRQMAGAAVGSHLTDFEITVRQQKFSNGTYSSPVTEITDNGLGKEYKYNGGTWGYVDTGALFSDDLTENEDFTVSYEYDAGGRVTKAFITGKGNYKSSQVIDGKDREVDIIIENNEIDHDDKVDLDSEYITAVLKSGKNLNYNGYSIEFVPSDIEVTEVYNGTTIKTLETTEYYIIGYDYKKDAYGNLTGGVKVAPKAAGKHTVWIQAAPGNKYYTGAVGIEYEIKGRDIKLVFALASDVPTQEALKQAELEQPQVAYIGSEVKLAVENYNYDYYKVNADGEIDWGSKLTRNTVVVNGKRKDLISFPDKGWYKLVVTPKEDVAETDGLSGYLDSNAFEVVARDIKKYQNVIMVTATPRTKVWPGETVTLDGFNLEVKDIGLPATNVLKQGVDYEAKIVDGDGDKIGGADIEITGLNNYAGTAIYNDRITIRTRHFTNDDGVDNLETVVRVNSLPYSGGNKIEFKDDDQEDKYVEVWLVDTTTDKPVVKVPASEYNVETRPDDPAQNGFGLGKEVTLIIRAEQGDGKHYAGTKEVYDVPIVEANIGDSTIFAVEGIEDRVYDNDVALEQDVTKIQIVDLRTDKPVDKNCWVVEGYTDNDKVGTATITLKAVAGSGYTGRRSVTYKIAERGLNAELTVAPASGTEVVYDGTAKTKESGAITVTVKDDKGVEVPEGAYTLSYTPDAVNAGVVTVTATANPDSTYAGKATGTFTIEKADNDVTASVEKVEVGKTTKVAVTAKGSGDITYSSSNAAVATVTTDGTVTGVSAGTAVITVSVAADRNYKAKSTTVTVTVTQKVAGKVTAYGVKKVFKNKKQSFTISASALGDAAISFKSDNKNITVNATTGKVTVKAGYVGTAKITITAAATEDYLKATKTVKVTIVPKATTLKSVTSKNGKITAKWAKKNIATCYQLQYATDKNFTKGKGKVWSKSETATSKTIKKTFTKGKTYYVRIRTCTRTDKSELLYSAWSAAKKVTIK